MPTREVTYVFHLPDQPERRLTVAVDQDSQRMQVKSKSPQAWTQLGHMQCSHCPLNTAKVSHCPLALAVIQPLQLCEGVDGKEKLTVDVIMDERTVSAKVSMQTAMSSLLGLIMPSSGCPHTRPLRAMARFHLPFATQDETLYRSASTYLLGQYLRDRAGQVPDYELAGFIKLYRDLHTLNRDFSKRLASMAKGSPTFTAMYFLDLFTIILPRSIDEMLEPIAPLFKAYTDQQ